MPFWQRFRCDLIYQEQFRQEKVENVVAEFLPGKSRQPFGWLRCSVVPLFVNRPFPRGTAHTLKFSCFARSSRPPPSREPKESASRNLCRPSSSAKRSRKYISANAFSSRSRKFMQKDHAKSDPFLNGNRLWVFPEFEFPFFDSEWASGLRKNWHSCFNGFTGV